MNTNSNIFINQILNNTRHNISSLSEILNIPKKRLLHQELMTAKDFQSIQKLKNILQK